MSQISTIFLAVVLLIANAAYGQTLVGDPRDIPAEEANTATAYYDSSTGDVYLSLGENLIFAGIEGADFGFVNGELDRSTINENTLLGSPFVVDDEIAWLRSSVALPAGIFNIGRLLPPNRRIFNRDIFADEYPEARFLYGPLGTNFTQGFEVIAPLPVAIPEPSGWALFAIVSTAAMLTRRRLRDS